MNGGGGTAAAGGPSVNGTRLANALSFVKPRSVRLTSHSFALWQTEPLTTLRSQLDKKETLSSFGNVRHAATFKELRRALSKLFSA